MLQQFQSQMMRAISYGPANFLYDMKFISKLGVRAYAASSELEVIKIPVTVEHKIKKAQSKKKALEREKKLKSSQQGRKSFPLISCKRTEFNHYQGQSYSKFQEIPLASKGWGHYKSAGDYFTINSTGSNPAFLHMDGEASDFNSLGLSKAMLAQIAKLGFEHPTNIQALAIPHILEGKNTLITAETGNGKTLAFLAPMLQQIAQKIQAYKDISMNTPLGLIIVPGRELAQQIHGVASELCEGLGIKVSLVMGGRTKSLMLHPQVNETHLLIATIGALSKLTTTGICKTNLIRHIVLDEADSLLDDSFSDIVLRYISKFPMQGSQSEDTTQPLALSGIQLTLVSATMPRSLHTILDPLVRLESIEKISTPYLHRIMPHVPQRFFRVNNNTKADKLLELVKGNHSSGVPVIIFSNKSKVCDWISLFLNENDIPCININGEMPAMLRRDRFEKFQSGEVIAMSCTDLASRGLDTIRAGHVINYEFPKFISDYIHRCGRIGRVGSKCTGLVTNLVHRNYEVELVKNIEYAARKSEEFHNVNANIKRILYGNPVKEGGII